MRCRKIRSNLIQLTSRGKRVNADLPGALAVGALGDDDDLVDGHDDGRPHKEAADEVRESHSWNTS